jgi:hypothetical protein
LVKRSIGTVATRKPALTVTRTTGTAAAAGGTVAADATNLYVQRLAA